VVVGTLVSAGFAAVVLVGVVATVVSCAVSPQALSIQTSDSNMTKQKNKGKILWRLDISYSFDRIFLSHIVTQFEKNTRVATEKYF